MKIGTPKKDSSFIISMIQVTQLTGFSDPVYAEAYVNVNQYDIGILVDERKGAGAFSTAKEGAQAADREGRGEGKDGDRSDGPRIHVSKV